MENQEELIGVAESLKSKKQKFSKLRVKYRDNIHIALLGACLDYKNLAYIKEHIKSDKEFAKYALQSSGYGMRYMPDSIRCDYELAKIAISTSPFCYSYIGDNLREDRTLALLAIQIGCSLALLLEHCDDKEIVLSAVNQSGLSLELASDRLKNDRDVVLAAVDEHPESIKHASSYFQELCDGKEPSLAIRSEIAKEAAEKLRSELDNNISTNRKMKI